MLPRGAVTHEHADAVLGLDDMRETKAWGSDWKDKGKIPATPVFLSEATYKHLQGVFPYLMPREKEQEVAAGPSSRNTTT